MSWQNIYISLTDISNSYKEKYGLDSDYQAAQKLIYSNPEVNTSLKMAISWLKIKPNSLILDIGVNNGYELQLLKETYSDELFSTLKIIGVDLIEDVLKVAAGKFDSEHDYKFIKGDIREFKGVDVLTGEPLIIEDKSIDVVIALTSLQSTSLVRDFEMFIEKLANKLKKESQLLIGTPNFHMSSSYKVVSGLFDAANNSVNENFALEISERLIKILNAHAFEHKQTGEIIIFDYFKRI